MDSEILNVFEMILGQRAAFREKTRRSKGWTVSPLLFARVNRLKINFRRIPDDAMVMEDKRIVLQCLQAIHVGVQDPNSTSEAEISRLLAETEEIVERGLRASGFDPELDTALDPHTGLVDALQTWNELQEKVVHLHRQARDQFAELNQHFSEERTRLLAKEELANQTAEIERSGQVEAGAKAVRQLQEMHEQASRLVDAMGVKGTTSNYKAIADREGRTADNLRWVTLGLFALGIVIALSTLYEHRAESTEWTAVLVKLFSAIIITTPAWYTAKESARHRSTADRARRMELELASLGPYTEFLPLEERTKIRQELTPKYFGNPTADHEVTPIVDPKQLLQTITEMLKAMKEK